MTIDMLFCDTQLAHSFMCPGDTNAAVAPPEGAEAADEEMADANPTLLRPIQTQRCRNFMKIQIPTTSSDLIEKRQHLKTGNTCLYAALVL